MTTYPMDWSIFVSEIKVFQKLHEDFKNVCLSYILRSRHGRTDILAKETKIINYIFPYKSDPDKRKCSSKN